MKKILTLLLMLLFVASAANATWTTPAAETTQRHITATVVDNRRSSRNNPHPYIQFKNRTNNKMVTVNWRVYGDGDQLQNGTVRFTGFIHKEQFGNGDLFSIDGMDNSNIRNYTVSIEVVSVEDVPSTGPDAGWTRPATTTNQDGISASIVDRRNDPDGAQNRYGFIEFQNFSDAGSVKVQWKVYGDDREVDHGEVTLGKRKHGEVFDYGEPFGVPGYRPQIRTYRVSIHVVK